MVNKQEGRMEQTKLNVNIVTKRVLTFYGAAQTRELAKLILQIGDEIEKTGRCIMLPLKQSVAYRPELEERGWQFLEFDIAEMADTYQQRRTETVHITEKES